MAITPARYAFLIGNDDLVPIPAAAQEGIANFAPVSNICGSLHSLYEIVLN